MADENETVKINADQALALLTSSSKDIESCWNEYVKEEYRSTYSDNKDNLIDVITLVDFIVNELKEGRSHNIQAFFNAVEKALETGDESAIELIIVGVLEGLQNNCGMENIDYHTIFNPWFGPKTSKTWEGLIYLWESNDSIEEKQDKLKDYRI